MNAKFGYCHGEIASSCGEVEEAGHHEAKKKQLTIHCSLWTITLYCMNFSNGSVTRSIKANFWSHCANISNCGVVLTTHK